MWTILMDALPLFCFQILPIFKQLPEQRWYRFVERLLITLCVPTNALFYRAGSKYATNMLPLKIAGGFSLTKNNKKWPWRHYSVSGVWLPYSNVSNAWDSWGSCPKYDSWWEPMHKMTLEILKSTFNQMIIVITIGRWLSTLHYFY